MIYMAISVNIFFQILYFTKTYETASHILILQQNKCKYGLLFVFELKVKYLFYFMLSILQLFYFLNGHIVLIIEKHTKFDAQYA
jgi:hypothetical protein